jgi:hypothetical protein
MNGMDTFNGAGDWMPPTLGEQQAAEINRRRQMAERLAAIGQTLDELGDLPKCGSLTKAKAKDVRQAYQTLHAWTLSLVDVTARCWGLAEDACQELSQPAVEIEKRPARRFSQSQVNLERIRLCKEG